MSRLIDADELKKDYINAFVVAYGVKCAELFENKFFHADIRCENFLDDKLGMQFAQGVR